MIKDKLILIPEDTANDSEFKENIELLKKVMEKKMHIFAVTNKELIIIDLDKK